MSYHITVSRQFYYLSLKKKIENKDVKIFVQNYLHYIKSVSDEHNIKLIEKLFDSEPKRYNNIPNSVYAYIAAITENVTKEMNIATPKWVDNELYFLEEPWFPPEVEKYNKIKEVLRKVSPEAFKKRNLYVSENAISVS